MTLDRTDATGVFEPYVASGALTVTEVAFARTVARLAGSLGDLELLALAVGAALVRLGQGQVELSRVAELFERGSTTSLQWPDAEEWLEVLRSSSVVMEDPPGAMPFSPDQRCPLVLSGQTLALERYVTYERLVANAITSRNAERGGDGASKEILDLLFGSTEDSDLQRLAVERAWTTPVSIIAGGPGTGKTHTIARLLIALGVHADRSQLPMVEVALVAPTGKAAARMTDALRHALRDGTRTMSLSSKVLAQLEALSATTIHRLLGRSFANGFAHDRNSPLHVKLVICDETSMVSLPLIARLLDALHHDARLVLVGDPAQLASIEVGTVMSDLVGPAKQVEGQQVHGALAGAVTVLERTHRFAADSPIARLAAAIRVGAVDEVLELLAHNTDEIEWITPENQRGMNDVVSLVTSVSEAAHHAAERGDSVRALAAVSSLKVLCAHRSGKGGLDDWTNRLAGARRAPLRTSWWQPEAGTPFMVTANDVANRLANGDTGIFVDVDGVVMAALDEGRGARLIAPSRLGRWEPWWAMTIHKSQGSEFAHVVVSLPEEPSALVSRELFYTAVTRAKARVTVCATEEVLRAAVARRVERASGLENRLWSPIVPPI